MTATLAAPPVRLDINGVSKRYGGVLALDDVSFQVRDGDVFGVIGSNGAGKSTLLGVISGAVQPTAGVVRLDGREVSGRGSERVARCGIGRAHQIPRPFRQMTVRQHADLAARLAIRSRSRRREHVDAVLERCGLAPRAERAAQDLGLLDLKRLEVARALAMAPRVLLLDEVAAGLVGREVDDVVELIRSIQSDGTTIVMVEHVQALIRELAAHVLVLEWGRVLTEGSPAAVAADPRVVEAYLGRPADTSRAGAAAEPANARANVTRPTPLLRVEHLDVAYGPQPALRDCTIDVGAGEVVAVLGANGAGKTTLARAISGIVPVRSGRIELDGATITRLPAHRRARGGLALCHEGRRLFREQTVEDNFLIAARRARNPARSAPDRIDDVLGLFPELQVLMQRQAGALSGGQQQMVAIGRALLLEPRVVIFDELSLGLAPVVAARLFEAIHALRERGLAVVLIEQNVGEALAVADHVYVLDHGVVTFSGSPATAQLDRRLRAAYLGAPIDQHAPEPRATAARTSSREDSQT